MSDRVKVLVTGAAGQIGYSLIPRLVDGTTFPNKTVDLELVEIPQVVSKLEGLVMEMEDSSFPALGKINFTDNFKDASKGCDWFLLVGSIPRGIVLNGKKIEERADLLNINGGIFVEQGEAIGNHGSDDAKILVVGNPANTNCLIGQQSAKNTSQTWMAMTMLDSNRAKSVLSKQLDENISKIERMIIWGNHSPTMYPDFENIIVDNKSGKELINDLSWIEDTFLPMVQQRGKAVIDSRGASSATSAAKAALDTVKACESRKGASNIFSAALMTNDCYELPNDLVCGLPLLSTPEGKIEIVRDLNISDFARDKINISVAELEAEKNAVKDLLKT